MKKADSHSRTLKKQALKPSPKGTGSRIEIPQRVTLASMTADSLRAAIQTGEWDDFLPSAKNLSRRLQVGYTTLRRALKILDHEGLIASSQGSCPRIVSGQRAKRKSKTVVFLSSARSSEVSRLMALARSELEHELHLAGFEVHEIFDYRFTSVKGTKRLDQIVHQVNAACWVLFLSNHEQQRYFASRGLPAFIVGHRHPDVKLPFMDINFEAVCRHATGQLLAKGHRRLCLLLPDRDDAGLIAREEGFRAEIASFKKEKATGIVLRHHGAHLEDMPRVLDSAFQGVGRPTGLIVADAWHTITAISYLRHKGMISPRDISIIGLDFEFVLYAYYPMIATYWIDHEKHTRFLARLVIRLVKTGAFSLKPNWFFPDFKQNGTIASPLSE